MDQLISLASINSIQVIGADQDYVSSQTPGVQTQTALFLALVLILTYIIWRLKHHSLDR